MNKFQKQNLRNIQSIFEQKTGTSLHRKPAVYHRPVRISVLAAVVCAFCLLMAAFTYPLFSPLSGDALTLHAAYEGDGIVTIQVENHSSKTLTFQPQLKLVKWITGEEVVPLSGTVGFAGSTIAPNSTGTMTVDLSEAYDMDLLEQSFVTQWYYLVLTNQNFVFGQEWKCSVYFGIREEEAPLSHEALYSMDPAIISQVEEELTFYFEDDYIGVFAANPAHYEYLQRVDELLPRSGKRIVPSVDGGLMVEPIPDGIIVDETFPPEKQYVLAGQSITVQDAFGKLVGSTVSEHMSTIQVFLPAYAGSEDQFWSIPLMYFSTYPVSAIESDEDCAFIHGQIVSFAELSPYQVYEDGQYVCYNVTHLFYTDLQGYVADILAMMEASNFQYYYFDEQVYRRIENIYNYYRDHLSIVSWEDFCGSSPYCVISDMPDAEDLAANGLRGVIDSNRDIEKIVITVMNQAGDEIYAGTFLPAEPRAYSLEDAEEASAFLRSLDDGVYTLDVAVWVDSDVMAYRSLWSQIFTTGSASWPGV